jgi:hypothetical protein
MRDEKVPVASSKGRPNRTLMICRSSIVWCESARGRWPAQADSKVVSNQDPFSTPNERKRHIDQNVRPISDRAKAIFFAILVAVVVLGYLLMTKLADDSRAENCMMAHRKNCGAIEWPSD